MYDPKLLVLGFGGGCGKFVIFCMIFLPNPVGMMKIEVTTEPEILNCLLKIVF